MAKYLSDEEVFGAPKYLSDDEVFGATGPADQPAPEPAPPDQQVVTSARPWRGAGAGRGSVLDPRRLDTAAQPTESGSVLENQRLMTDVGNVEPPPTDPAELVRLSNRGYAQATDPAAPPSAASPGAFLTPAGEPLIPINQRGIIGRAADLAGAQIDQYASGLGYTLGDAAQAVGATGVGANLRARSAALADRADRSSRSVALSADGDFEKYAPQILAVFPTMAVAAATGGLPVMFGISHIQAYAEGRKAGLEPAAALARAVPMGAAEVLGEKMGGTGKFLQALENVAASGLSTASLKQLGGKMLAMGAKEVPSEEATYGMQAGIDMMPGIGLNQDMTPQEFVEGAKDTAIVAAGMGGLAGAGGAALSRLPRGSQDQSAEALARSKGFLVDQPRMVSFADPSGPASQAGITPIVVPLGGQTAAAPQVEAPPAAEQPPTAAGQPSASPKPVPQTADQKLLDRVPQEQEPEEVLMRRGGGGYETQEAAQTAMGTAQQRSPTLRWQIEPMANGNFRVAGYAQEQAAPQPAAPKTYDIPPVDLRTTPVSRREGRAMSLRYASEQQAMEAATHAGIADNVKVEDTGTHFTLTPAEKVASPNDNPAEAEKLVADLRTAARDQGIKLAPPVRAGQDSEPAGGAGRSANQGLARKAIQLVSRVTQAAFGFQPVVVTGLGNLGVAHNGSVFVDADVVAEEAGSGRGGVAALAVATVGHEATHGLLQQGDEESRTIYENFKKIVSQYLHEGVVEQRRQQEAKHAKEHRVYGTTEYAHSEVIADINGAMWLDPRFWKRLHEIDNGSTMRRVAYRFMQAATKFIEAAKGTRLDINTFVSNVDAVREAAAQAWAEKAKLNSRKLESRTAIKQKLFDAEPSYSRPGTQSVSAPAVQLSPEEARRQELIKESGLRVSSNATGNVTVNDLKQHGLFPERALSATRVTIERDGSVIVDMPFHPSNGEARPYSLRFGKGSDSYSVSTYGSWLHTGDSGAPAEDIFRFGFNQTASTLIHKSGFDLASAYRKNTILRIASTWKEIAKKTGFFRLARPAERPSNGSLRDMFRQQAGLRLIPDSIEEIAASMNAFPGWSLNVVGGGDAFIFTRNSDGSRRNAYISMRGSQAFQCCTMGLADSNLGVPFYAVVAEWALANNLKFYADSALSGINTFRRTEQAASFALKTGNTGVLLPGRQNRVYGFNENPQTEEDHDFNIARLMLAGMRNVMEVDPDIRRLSYDPATDSFTEYGRDANDKVDRFIKSPAARAFGMGRTTVARAVLTSEVVSGRLDPDTIPEFKTSIAYSRRPSLIDDTGRLSEEWGEPGEPTPKVSKFLGKSVMQQKDGTPIPMFRDGDQLSTKPSGDPLIVRAEKPYEGKLMSRSEMRSRGYDSVWIGNGEDRRLAVFNEDQVMPAFSRGRRRSGPSAEKIGSINSLGNFNVDQDLAGMEVDEDYQLTPAEKSAKLEAEMQAELMAKLEEELQAEGYSVVGKPKNLAATPVSQRPVDLSATTDAAIKAAGIMAESAYPKLVYHENLNKLASKELAEFIVGGKTYRAPVDPDRSPGAVTEHLTDQFGFDVRGVPSQYDMKGMSMDAKRAWNHRFAAAADLFRRGFDLYTSVPAAAQQRVLNVWQSIAKNGKAFEFGGAVAAKGRTVADVAQGIADQMLDGTRYDAYIDPNPLTGNDVYDGFGIDITDSAKGSSGTADIEFHRLKKRVIVHVENLQKNSGLGKPVYQIAQAFAAAFGATIESHDVLLGSNNYRRTEQMFSGALRSGNYATMQPGIGQRIYGWKGNAKKADQQGRNLVRMALAAARNAAEFVPDIKHYRYDLATDQFVDRRVADTPENRAIAADEIADVLNDNDAREVGISRSTLARAAITFEALDQEVKVPSDIKSPVLYSRRMPDTSRTKESLARKFERLRRFNEDLPRLMDRIEADAPNIEEAAILKIIASTGFRVGSAGATSSGQQTYGASTLRREHVRVDGNVVHFDFLGKSGVRQRHSIEDAQIAAELRRRLDREKLFSKADRAVRKYLDSITGADYKVHDFRTWAATRAALDVVNDLPPAENEAEYRAGVNLAASVAATKIGDTLETTLEYYVDPQIFQDWRSRSGLPAAGVQEGAGEGQDQLDAAEDDAAAARDDGSVPEEPLSYSRRDLTSTPEFKRWFSGSKVVDKRGRPLVVYHGSMTDFDVFEMQKHGAHFGSSDHANYRLDWAATSPYAKRAKRNAGAPVVYPVYLSIKNPMRVGDGEDTPDVIERAKKLGHDGLVYLNRGEIDTDDPEDFDLSDAEFRRRFGATDSYVAFYPEQVKSAIGNNGNFDPSDPRINYSRRPFYSALQRQVEAIQSKAQAPEGWIASIKGLVNKGAVKADEVEWSGVNDWLRLQQGRVTRDQVLEYLRGNGVQVTETVLSRDGVPNNDEWEPDDGRVGNTRYGNYTLPGGTNYREVLLTLPKREDSESLREIDARIRELHLDMEYADDDELVGMQQEQRALAERRLAARKDEFLSGHWDQPNVIAHIRVDDRADADGKRVLFVEEIQSDWAQAGRKRGFQGSKRFTVRPDSSGIAALSDRWEVIDQDGNIEDGFRTEAQAQRWAEREQKGQGVPTAPFVGKTDAWVALALKRIIKMAVDEGYDRVAFVNGEQSATRYSLDQQVEALSWSPTKIDGAARDVQIDLPDSNPLRLRVDGDGAVLAANGPGFARYKGKGLDEVIGKELAERVLRDQSGKLSGDGLKIEQNGMRAFYDQIVPSVLKDVLRKVGGGQLVPVAFDKGNQSGWYERSPSGANLGFTQDAATAQRWRAAGLNVVSESMSQPGFDITPAMREKAADGLPMFSRRQTETPEFRNWFGDSKVVDEQGRPLVVYHGTTRDIGAFDSNAKSVDPSFAITSLGGRFGFFFTPDSSLAEEYAAGGGMWNDMLSRSGKKTDGDGPAIYPVYLSIKSPMVIEASRLRELEKTSKGFQSKFKRDAEAAGHDGVIAMDGGKILEAVAFRPEQVKSAIGNNGNFDPNDPRIAYSRRPSGLPGESRFMRMRRLLQDQFIQVKVIQDTLTQRGGTVGEAQDVYRAEERMHGRVTALLQDFARNQIEPFVKKVVDYGLTLDEVSLYAYAMHAKERNAYIKSINPRIGDAGSGMSDVEADNILQLARLSGDQAKFDDLHQMLMGITDTTRHVLLQEGLITQDEFNGWTNLYQHYVPLRGFEGVDPEGNPKPGYTRGFSMTGKESIRALGRTSKAGQILENIIRDHERAVVRSEKNAVAKTFLDLALSNPDPNLWEVQPVRYVRSVSRTSGLVLMHKTPDTGEDTFDIKVAGQQVRVKVKDELLLRALKTASKDDTSQLEQLLANTLGAYTSLMRNTLTRYNPIFGAINAVRDAQFGAMSTLDELGAKGVKLYAKYLGEALAASWRSERGAPANKVMDRWMTEMRFAGGSTGGYHTRDLNEITDSMKTMLLQHGAAPTTKMEAIRGSLAYRQAAAAMKWLEIIGATSEDAARVAAYRAAREMGKTPAEAASISKNLTTNFNRKGEWGQTINSLYLFFNAGVQGSARLVQALGNRRVQYMMAGLTAAAMAIALANAGAGDDDDGQAYWDKIPDYEKERNLIFMLPPGVDMDGAQQVGKRGRYIKVPMPYGINIFPVLGNQIADLVRYGRDNSRGVSPAKAAVNMVSAIFGSMNPFGGSVDPTSSVQVGMAVAPTFADFGIQLMAGVNAFGRPVGPQKSEFDDRPDSESYTARQAGGAAQRLAQWLNSVSGGNEGRSGYLDFQPGTLENVVRNTTGGLGVFLADVFVNLPTKLYAAPDSMTQRDVPLWRNFYGEVDAVTDQSLFYERRAEVTREMDAAKREMKLGIDVDYSPESQAMQSLGKAAESYTKWMTQLRKREIEIAADPNMTKGEKLIARRELEKARGQIAEGFNTMYVDTMRGLSKKQTKEPAPAQ